MFRVVSLTNNQCEGFPSDCSVRLTSALFLGSLPSAHWHRRVPPQRRSCLGIFFIRPEFRSSLRFFLLHILRGAAAVYVTALEQIYRVYIGLRVIEISAAEPRRLLPPVVPCTPSPISNDRNRPSRPSTLPIDRTLLAHPSDKTFFASSPSRSADNGSTESSTSCLNQANPSGTLLRLFHPREDHLGSQLGA